MKQQYNNKFNSERIVEVDFIVESIKNYFRPGIKILDVGGIPTRKNENTPIINLIQKLGVQYYIADFRGGDFHGDFVKYDFKENKFDIIIFLSSLEHFPQCTEGDKKFREGEDINGYKKALSILNNKGKIFITVPYGIDSWQPYHRSYDKKSILTLTNGSNLIEDNIYNLKDNNWIRSDMDLNNVNNKTKIHGVGCFVFEGK